VTRRTAQLRAKIAHVSLDSSLHRGWSMDYFGVAPIDFPVLAGPAAFVEQLLPVVERKVAGQIKWRQDARNTAPEPIYSQNADTEIAARDIEVALENPRDAVLFLLALVGVGLLPNECLSPVDLPRLRKHLNFDGRYEPPVQMPKQLFSVLADIFGDFARTFLGQR
jgi:hypothetical protein